MSAAESHPKAKVAAVPVAFAVLGAVLLATFQTVRAQDSATAALATSPPADTLPHVAADTTAASALRPGDVLRIRIWREPDLSGDYPVDEQGTAVLPRLGPLTVIGIPASQLKQRLADGYRLYLNNPSIEVTPLRRIAVLGAVRNPGIYPVPPSVTLGEAPNVAGGATNDSKRNMIELRRGSERRTVNLQRQPELSTLPLASGDQVYLPERSWMSRNSTWFVSTLVGAAGTAALLIFR